jgi:FLVCR family feline leukemia virus subgroup C receptor-related protein
MDKQTSGLTVNDSISHHSTSTVTLKVKVEVAEKVPDEPQYILYSWRWVILFFFAMNELLNTMVYPVCNPIAPAIGKIYGKGAIVVAMTATLFLFMHPLFTFPASYTIINKGVAYSVKIGATLTLLGTLVRCFALVSRYE